MGNTASLPQGNIGAGQSTDAHSPTNSDSITEKGTPLTSPTLSTSSTLLASDEELSTSSGTDTSISDSMGSAVDTTVTFRALPSTREMLEQLRADGVDVEIPCLDSPWWCLGLLTDPPEEGIDWPCLGVLLWVCLFLALVATLFVI